jgi:hypothetical protein
VLALEPKLTGQSKPVWVTQEMQAKGLVWAEQQQAELP